VNLAAGSERLVLVGPQGPRPHRWWAPSRIFVYGVLLLSAAVVLFPLYVMIITSIKDLDANRQGNLFVPPESPTRDAWITAWDEACSGLYCEGLKVGFWNSVRITAPSVALSIFLGSLAGYVLALWRYRGATMMFSLLLFCIFIPPQVILYPLSVTVGAIRMMGTLQGVILVNTILGIPFMALLFRNAFAGLPSDMFRAARVDGAGFWRIYWEVLLPLLRPVIAVALLLQVTYIWGDYFFSAVFGGMEATPMTVQFHNIVNNVFGISEPNVDMAATILTAAVPLIVYLACGRLFIRGIMTGLAPRR
jgi:glucose/mannose transport system permease protein